MFLINFWLTRIISKKICPQENIEREEVNHSFIFLKISFSFSRRVLEISTFENFSFSSPSSFSSCLIFFLREIFFKLKFSKSSYNYSKTSCISSSLRLEFASSSSSIAIKQMFATSFSFSSSEDSSLSLQVAIIAFLILLLASLV